MPSQHAPEKSLLQTLRKKVATGRMTAMKGRVGRELTEEEMRDCQEQLAALELKRKQGIQNRRHTSAEADRVIGAAASHGAELRQSGVAVMQHVDGRFDAVDGRLDGVHARLDRVLGTPGSAAECDQQMLQLRQEKKRRVKEEREAARAAEKKRKLEEP